MQKHPLKDFKSNKVLFIQIANTYLMSEIQISQLSSTEHDKRDLNAQ